MEEGGRDPERGARRNGWKRIGNRRRNGKWRKRERERRRRQPLHPLPLPLPPLSKHGKTCALRFLLLPPSFSRIRHARSVHIHRNYRYRRIVTSVYVHDALAIRFVHSSPSPSFSKRASSPISFDSRDRIFPSLLFTNQRFASFSATSFSRSEKSSSNASFPTGFFARMTYGARPIGRFAFLDSRALPTRALHRARFNSSRTRDAKACSLSRRCLARP